MTMVTSTKSVSVTGRNGRVRRNAGLKIVVRSGIQPKTEKQPGVSIGRGASHQPDVRPANKSDNVSDLALLHGRYEVVDSVVRHNLLETELTPLIVNRAVTVIDDWIDAGVFHSREVRVIERARELWRDIKRPRHPYFDPPDPDDLEDGPEAERAKNLLRRCRALVGRERWYVFENVIRWNEPTGIPGSRIANIAPSSIAAAQEMLRNVAGEIDRSWIL